MIDKEGKLFGRVNVLDFLIVVSILMLVAAVIFMFTGVTVNSKELKPMKVTVYVDEVQPNVADEMKEVKEVYFGRGLVKTKVEKVEVLPMPAGSRRPDFKEVRITLSGNGYTYEEGAYFGNQRVSLNKKIWLRSIYETEATVMDIK